MFINGFWNISYEYGYVLRYPSDKVTITQKESCNIFRYVGKENAQKDA